MSTIQPENYLKFFDKNKKAHGDFFLACLRELQRLNPKAFEQNGELHAIWSKQEDSLPVQASPGSKGSPQINRSEWNSKVSATNLSQPDVSTCQSACIAMALGMKPQEIATIRRQLVAMGAAGDPYVMGRVVKKYTNKYSFTETASIQDMAKWLMDGELLITHGWFTRSGHVICLDGLKISELSAKYEFNVKDPYSEFDFPSWSYNKSSRFYDGFYSELGIYSSCVASTSAQNAKTFYSSGKINRALENAFVHRFWR